MRLNFVLFLSDMLRFRTLKGTYKSALLPKNCFFKTLTRLRLESSTQPSFYGSDTIYALSSGGMVKAGVAVIRITGPSSKYCLESLLKDQSFPKPRMASLRYLICPHSRETLDKGLVLWFPGPKSFTGEDCVELHIHSGLALINGVLDSLSKLDNQAENRRVRPAERGEFTQRAYFNNKMDLTEVEGLSDLLAAETTQQRNQALRQMDGSLKIQYETWREEIIRCLAHTEAVIDFGDDDRENDINESSFWELIPRVRTLRDNISIHLNDGRRGEILRDGVQIVLVGPPNAGKSSLLNILAKRPASIVSPIAGTTRLV
jgi:tRNA modification GTPase